MSRLCAALFAVSCAFQTACATEPATKTGDLTAEQVAEGKVLYDTNGCAACHGPGGRGDGPLAPLLTPRPRDFASPAAFKGPRTVVAVAGVIARGIPSTPHADAGLLAPRSAVMPATGRLCPVHRRRREPRALVQTVNRMMANPRLKMSGLTLTSTLALTFIVGPVAEPLAGASPRVATLRTEGAWVRQPAPSRHVTAAYLVFINDGDEAVRVVSGESALARTVELHQMVMEGGMMRMSRVKEIVVPPKARVELKPGGLHVMLFGVKRRLEVGDRVPLTFRLAAGGTVSAQATVRAPGTAR